ncbi:hypothetical protein [Streptomyces maremycinicus]|uniref:hypothetical protein n=1 Tax=Streptomyces maremycinicus TaxID=1679753 RepID=UPI00078812AB|nr:hypothetical protein [Streptomyces sp. NBRC 110468]
MTPITGLDLTGFTEREPGVWTDAAGLVLSVHFFPLIPDLPAPLHEPERLGAGLTRLVAGVGGGLIEAAPGSVDGVPAVRQLVKMPLGSRRGQAFLGSWTVPRAGSSTVVKVQAAEGATTGMREAVILAEVGPAAYFRPHPYTGEQPGGEPGRESGGLPYHVGDDERWDARFPGHPLTLVRAALHRITPTITFDDRFKALPPFAGPAGPQSPASQSPPPQSPASRSLSHLPPPRRGWFRRKGV